MDQSAARGTTRRPVVFRDGLGRRCRMVDAAGNEKLEILCVRQELAATDAFEPALRQGVERLTGFRDESFARLRAVQRLNDQTATLVLVSETTAGTRLSDLLATSSRKAIPIGRVVAWSLVRQLVAAVARFHRHSADRAHGAIAPERLVVTPEGRLVLVEQALGAALEHLKLSTDQFWRELRVAFPRGAKRPALDHRADITQVGLVALALVLERLLQDDEYPERIGFLIDAAWAGPPSDDEQPLPGGLRSWLTRCLQLEPRNSFQSAIEAHDDLESLFQGTDFSVPVEDIDRFLMECRPTESGRRLAASAAADVKPAEAAHLDLPVAARATTPPTPRAVVDRETLENRAETGAAARVVAPRFGMLGTDASSDDAFPSAPPQTRRSWIKIAQSQPARSRQIAAAAVLIAVCGMGWAATRGSAERAEASEVSAVASPAAAAPSSVAPTATNAPTAADPVPTLQPGVVTSDFVTPATGPALPPTAAALATSGEIAPLAPPSPAPGWVTIKAPGDVQVFEKGSLLGSSRGGRISLPPGAHEIELVSDAVGYRGIRAVQVRSGESAAITVEFPNGTLALNATPWAEVLVDGKSVGETPIGNLPLSLGSHEVVFRHPELGEQRMTTTITLKAPTRLSVDMRKR